MSEGVSRRVELGERRPEGLDVELLEVVGCIHQHLLQGLVVQIPQPGSDGEPHHLDGLGRGRGVVLELGEGVSLRIEDQVFLLTRSELPAGEAHHLTRHDLPTAAGVVGVAHSLGRGELAILVGLLGTGIPPDVEAVGQVGERIPFLVFGDRLEQVGRQLHCPSGVGVVGGLAVFPFGGLRIGRSQEPGRLDLAFLAGRGGRGGRGARSFGTRGIVIRFHDLLSGGGGGGVGGIGSVGGVHGCPLFYPSIGHRAQALTYLLY